MVPRTLNRGMSMVAVLMGTSFWPGVVTAGSFFAPIFWMPVAERVAHVGEYPR